MISPFGWLGEKTELTIDISSTQSVRLNSLFKKILMEETDYPVQQKEMIVLKAIPVSSAGLPKKRGDARSRILTICCTSAQLL